MKQLSGWFCFVLLLGAVTGFAAGKWDAQAQSTVDNKTSRYLAGVVTYGTSTDAFMLFDSQTNRLVAYTIGGNKRLELMAVRELSYDMKMVSWGKQEPTVQEVKDAYEKAEKDQHRKADAPDKK
jgi:hypothetical protein